MSAPIRQFSFSGGELSPSLYARTDLNRYENGLRTIRNMMVMRQGGVTGRPGTEYVSTALNGGNQVRLIPFIFNETGLGQSYVLEFGNQYIAFYQNGGNVISSSKAITAVTQDSPGVVTAPSHGFSEGDIITVEGALGMAQLNNGYFIVRGVTTNTFFLHDLLDQNFATSTFPAYIGGGIASKIYMIASPFLQADLQNLQFAESADIVTITHQNYIPQELKRFGPTNWTISNVVLNNFTVPSPISSGGGSGSFNYRYVVTALFPNGDESLGSINGFCNGKAQLSLTNPIVLTWSAIAGASGYRIYRGDGNGATNFVGVGFIGQTIASTPNASFTDTGLTPDYSNTNPTQDGFSLALASGAGNWPAAVGFSQQRRCFAATANNPIGCWMSRPGSYSTFSVHPITVQDDDAIDFTIAGEEVNAIQHLLELKFMLMLTAGAEIYVQGNGSGVVTPSAINASTQSQYGASPLKPLKVADVLIFNQALGSSIRDFTFDFAIDGYRGNDITIFSSHLFEGFQIVDWCYQKVPDSIIWAVRSDGVLLSCTYVREQEMIAWTRHDFTDGFVENVVAIPENGEYAVYASIRRVIGGNTVRYIERISSRLWPDTVNTPPVRNDPINSSYLDCFLKYDGRIRGGNTLILYQANGQPFDTTSAAYEQILVVRSSSAYFTAAMVGEQIFIEDQAWVNSQGKEGNQVRCIIQSFQDSTHVTVTPDTGVVPVEFQTNIISGPFVGLTLWSLAIQKISGLGYLEGQKISVWADRFVVGSPLNSQVDIIYTVTGGSVTLDKPYSVICAGLPMTQDLESLDLESYFGETMLGKRKRVSRVAVYVYNTRTFFAGGQNPDTNEDNTNGDPTFQLDEEKSGRDQETYDEAPSLMTKQDYVIVPTRWTHSGRTFFRNVDPVPFSLLAIAPSSEDPVQTPYKRGG